MHQFIYPHENMLYPSRALFDCHENELGVLNSASRWWLTLAVGRDTSSVVCLFICSFALKPSCIHSRSKLNKVDGECQEHTG